MMPTKYPQNPLHEFFTSMESMFTLGDHSVDSQTQIQIDVVDMEDELLITADVPGFERDDLELTIENDGQTLTIYGHRDEGDGYSSEDTDGEYIWQERMISTVQRSVSLPTQVDTSEVDASYVNGVLSVTLQKVENETQSPIDIHWDETLN